MNQGLDRRIRYSSYHVVRRSLSNMKRRRHWYIGGYNRAWCVISLQEIWLHLVCACLLQILNLNTLFVLTVTGNGDNFATSVGFPVPRTHFHHGPSKIGKTAGRRCGEQDWSVSPRRCSFEPQMSWILTQHPFFLGGKGTVRRKIVRKTKPSAAQDDKKLQGALKKLNVQPIAGVEEVNMFREDGNVLHFTAPKGEFQIPF
jgi:hypothetical protein